MKVLVTGGSGFIGTSLVTGLIERGFKVCNVDVRPPLNPQQSANWSKGDIMSLAEIETTLTAYQPDTVIHLAGRTDCDENTTVENDYQLNVQGTKNVLDAIKKTPAVKRLIMTSSQFVCGPGRLPASDEEYFPHTVYGQSKVETERLTRSAGLSCDWTIIRPVNIWGPYHERYSREFWKIADKGLYLHPGVPIPTRTYGYVGNVVWQMIKMLEADKAVVNEQVFYVGDNPITIDKWVMGFCEGFRAKRPIVIPLWAMTILARCGDVISKFMGKPFYITSSRLRSMTEDYYAPMDKTFETFGEAPYTLEEGIRETVKWHRGTRQSK